METIEQLKRQLEGLDDLRSIVKTMKALSAASIRQYEAAAEALSDYYRTVELGLQVVLREQLPVASGADRDGGFAAIVFGSDHGLCGRFNEAIVEYLLESLPDLPGAPHQRRYLTVGARAAGHMEASGLTVEENFWVPGTASRITATVREILVKIEIWQREAGVRHVSLFYNRSRNGGGFDPMGVQLLPIDLERFHGVEQARWPSRRLPQFNMEPATLLAALLRQYFFATVFRACAESQASEHAARLAAMQSAERNLDDRLTSVTGEYRRGRQSAITAELLDVVAGFEAIAGEAL